MLWILGRRNDGHDDEEKGDYDDAICEGADLGGVGMATKENLDPQKLMELAVEVMRQSVPENRLDGSPSPLVGAVLLRPSGTIETAARGELRGGNHAEFVLLERKCFSERLDGCILFTTLEPCMDRNEPKKGCAKHIVSARITEVYVGVQDDNPTVAGKGIEYLRQHGVLVHMFDRDLQQEILDANAEFFEGSIHVTCW